MRHVPNITMLIQPMLREKPNQKDTRETLKKMNGSLRDKTESALLLSDSGSLTNDPACERVLEVIYHILDSPSLSSARRLVVAQRLQGCER